MMNEQHTRDPIDDEVSRTLSSLDGLGEIGAGPYFFTRAQQRLADTQSAPGRGLRLRPAYVALILLLNIVTISITLASDRSDVNTRPLEVAAMAQEYSLGPAGSVITLGGGESR